MGVSTWPRCVRDSGRDARVTVTRQCARDRDFGLCVATVRSRQRFWALCRDRVLRVATWFLGQQGGLGHDRGFLCRDRFFSPVSRQKFCVATGFGDGSGLGREKGLLVSRKSFPKVGTFLSRQGFQGWCCDRVFFCRNPQTMPTSTTKCRPRARQA